MRKLPIIAEDLGFLTAGVHRLLEETGFPGMKVMEFAFDTREESDYLPHNYRHNAVVYTGTHDNDTVMGWTHTAPPEDVLLARRYLHVDDREGFNWAMIRTAMMSVADTAIFPMADFLGLGSEGRINVPSTVGGNWRWRIGEGCINDWLAGIIRENTELYGRAPRGAAGGARRMRRRQINRNRCAEPDRRAAGNGPAAGCINLPLSHTLPLQYV